MALSKPRPLVGSPNSHGSVACSSLAGGSKYGGKAGLSVPTVRVPGVLVGRSAAAQDAASLAEADADGGGRCALAALAGRRLAGGDEDAGGDDGQQGMNAGHGAGHGLGTPSRAVAAAKRRV